MQFLCGSNEAWCLAHDQASNRSEAGPASGSTASRQSLFQSSIWPSLDGGGLTLQKLGVYGLFAPSLGAE